MVSRHFGVPLIALTLLYSHLVQTHSNTSSDIPINVTCLRPNFCIRRIVTWSLSLFDSMTFCRQYPQESLLALYNDEEFDALMDYLKHDTDYNWYWIGLRRNPEDLSLTWDGPMKSTYYGPIFSDVTSKNFFIVSNIKRIIGCSLDSGWFSLNAICRFYPNKFWREGTSA